MIAFNGIRSQFHVNHAFGVVKYVSKEKGHSRDMPLRKYLPHCDSLR